MQIDNAITILSIIGLTSTVFYVMFRITKYAFLLNITMLSFLVFYISEGNEGNELVLILLYLVCPLMLINTGLYVFLHKTENKQNGNTKYQVNFTTNKGNFKLDNIKRGASVIGSDTTPAATRYGTRRAAKSSAASIRIWSPLIDSAFF